MNEVFFTSLVSQAQQEGIARHVVGAVMQRTDEILLLARPSNEFMGGIYELPSGRVEDGEDLQGALCREVEEETGLRVNRIEQYLGSFDYRSKSGALTRQFNFVVTLEASSPVMLSEHDSYAWCHPQAISDYPVSSSVKQILENLNPEAQSL